MKISSSKTTKQGNAITKNTFSYMLPVPPLQSMMAFALIRRNENTSVTHIIGNNSLRPKRTHSASREHPREAAQKMNPSERSIGNHPPQRQRIHVPNAVALRRCWVWATNRPMNSHCLLGWAARDDLPRSNQWSDLWDTYDNCFANVEGVRSFLRDWCETI